MLLRSSPKRGAATEWTRRAQHWTRETMMGLCSGGGGGSGGGGSADAASEWRRRRAVQLCVALVLIVLLYVAITSWRTDGDSLSSASRWGRRLHIDDEGREEFSDSEAAAADDSADSAPSPFAPLTHLVLVAGHAVLTGTDVHDLTSASNWALLDYQREQLPTFVAHIRRGVEIARGDPRAMLVFSGGETRAKAGPRSEAQSYWTAADHAHWFLPTADAVAGEDSQSNPSDDALAATVSPVASAPLPEDDVPSRSLTEEFARDSFENLLFSVCRFREAAGHYPSRITVVGFGFKEPRFRELHRAAIRFPEKAFEYEGIDPPWLSASATTSTEGSSDDARAARAARSAALLASEQSQSFLPFQKDPYGCHAPLADKKRSRNPFRRSHKGYEHSCPEIKALLRYCKRTIFEGPLPWDDRSSSSKL